MAKEKTTWTQPSAVDGKLQTVEALPTVRLCYNNVEMSADMMHLNKVLFLTSISHDIHCRTVDAVDNMTCTALEKELINVIRCYMVRGFNVILITADAQFKSLKD